MTCLYDSYGRPLTHLRITVTHKCNYHCLYCHEEGEYTTQNELKINEYLLIARAIAKLGIKYIKITGGEPLIRDDIEEVLKVFYEEASPYELSLVTNGYFLLDKLESIKKYINRINISLPSLNRNVYIKITGVDGLSRTLKGIRRILDYELKMKLNVVVTKLNYSEVNKIVDFANKLGVDVSLIELIPLGRGRVTYKSLYKSLDQIEEEIKKRAVLCDKRSLHNRRVYTLPEGIQVEIVKSYGNPTFCKGCTRIRVTASGKIKPCLMRMDNLVDLRNVLLANIPQDVKVDLIVERFKQANFLREPFFK